MEELIGQTLGQYRIMEQIGEGGMATVYKAYQPALDRYVAVKVLPPVFAQEQGFSERFLREAKAIANLHHRNILPVYDSGQDDDYSYIVMRYIEGARTLKDVMAEPLGLERVAGLIEQVAAALDHAHRQGVIHRDVKPANVLMDGDWALLMDFGLAKIAEASVQLTGTGVGIGTPAYMSPEQGQGLEVDHRTDIYSLGIILFEMLTGKIPHDAETPFAIVLKRVTEPLPIPRSINPEIPEPIERVILKTLATEPADRFESAGEMAAALRKACETVEEALVFERETLVPAVDEVEEEKVVPARLTPAPPARPVRTGEVAVEREAIPVRQVAPIWVWGALGVALFLAVALAWVMLGGQEAEPTLTAVAAMQATTPAAAVQPPTLTDTPLPPASTPQPTDTPTPMPPTDTPTPTPLPLPKVTISPDNVDELVEVARLGEGRAGGNNLAFSPDGWLLASPEDNNVNLWRVSDGALLQTLSGHELAIGSLAFSPDGTMLASAVTGMVAMEPVRLSRVSDGTLLRSLFSFYVSALAFSPNGEILAAGKRLGEVELWDVSKGNMLLEVVGHTDQEKGKSKDVNDLAFSPDGEILASCAYKAKLWRVSDGTLLRTLDAPGYVDSLAFNPDGEILATGDGSTVQLWRVSDGGLLLTLEGHTDDVRSLVFSPSGELLASLSDDKTVRLWRVSGGALLRTLEMEDFTSYMTRHKVDFAPDGTLLAFGGVDGTIRLWGIGTPIPSTSTPTPSSTYTPGPTDTPLPPTPTPVPPTDTPTPLPTSPIPSLPTPLSPPSADRAATVDGLPVLPNGWAYGSNLSGNWEIYVMEGGQPRRLTDHPAYDCCPYWSPDGSQIAFYRREGDTDGNGLVTTDDHEELWVMNSDGANPIQVSADGGDKMGRWWSPDGRKLAFMTRARDVNGDGEVNYEDDEVYVVGADGSGLANMIDGGAENTGFVGWTLDSQRLIIEGRLDTNDDGQVDYKDDNAIYSVGSDGSGLTRLSKPGATAYAGSPTYLSPEGAHLALVSRRDSNSDGQIDYKDTMELYAMNLDGSGMVALTEDDMDDWTPTWSPDGRRIAFLKVDGDEYTYNLYTVNPDGSGTVRLTDDPSHKLSPGWAPDGSKIAFAVFSEDTDGNGRLTWGDKKAVWLVSAEGGPTVWLTNLHGDVSFSWSPDSQHLAIRIRDRDANDDGSVTSTDAEQLFIVSADERQSIGPLLGEGNLSYRWSEDGNTLYFIHRSQDTNGDGIVGMDDDGEVYAISADGSSLTRLSERKAGYRGFYKRP